MVAAVRERYGAIALGKPVAGACGPAPTGCCAPSAAGVAATLGYSAVELDLLPEGANLGLGCGAPVAQLGLTPGETVLDLGCGGGIDLLLAARQVGPAGRAIGVDMTPEMVEKARAAGARAASPRSSSASAASRRCRSTTPRSTPSPPTASSTWCRTRRPCSARRRGCCAPAAAWWCRTSSSTASCRRGGLGPARLRRLRGRRHPARPLLRASSPRRASRAVEMLKRRRLRRADSRRLSPAEAEEFLARTGVLMSEASRVGSARSPIARSGPRIGYTPVGDRHRPPRPRHGGHRLARPPGGPRRRGGLAGGTGGGGRPPRGPRRALPLGRAGRRPPRSRSCPGW